MNNSFTHFNDDGNAHMVNISQKADTEREAVVEGYIRLRPETLQLIAEKGHKKGDVLTVARLAAIMGAKKTPDLIPLCHPITITHIDVDFTLDSEKNTLRCEVSCKTVGKTGIEMEALVACNTALMTIYDMCKAVDRGMTIDGVRLLEKCGGVSGHWTVNVE